MQAYVWWFVLGFGLVVAELMTGTFYLLVIAIALACAGVAAFLGMPLAVQLVIAAAIGLGGSLWLRKSRFGRLHAFFSGDAVAFDLRELHHGGDGVVLRPLPRRISRRRGVREVLQQRQLPGIDIERLAGEDGIDVRLLHITDDLVRADDDLLPRHVGFALRHRHPRRALAATGQFLLLGALALLGVIGVYAGLVLLINT